MEEPIQPQPKPRHSKRSHAAFLEDAVADNLPSNPAPKRSCPEPLSTYINRWIESAESVSERERSCKSDSFLIHSDEDLIPRRLTKSVSDMNNQWNNGFAVPSAPASAHSIALSRQSNATTASSGKSLVEQAGYREKNLLANNIHMRYPHDDFPDGVARLVDGMSRRRDSPGPSFDEVRRDTELADLELRGVSEGLVEDYFRDDIFPKTKSSDTLRRDPRIPMYQTVVPTIHPTFKVSTPVPDMLYGYSRNVAFPDQQAQLISMGSSIDANSQFLDFPFFVIEFKADGASGTGSLWVATNQCLGASATCVNVAENLNQQLKSCGSENVLTVDSAAFSIAMNGSLANLYVSWKHDDFNFYTKRVKAFCLQEPDQYLNFRKHVRNIIDWGRDVRLKSIRNSLDFLLEQRRKRASEQAKSRAPLSSTSDSSSTRSKRSKGSRT